MGRPAELGANGVVYLRFPPREAARAATAATRGRPIPLSLAVTDSDLLARLRASDHAAFDQLFRQWYEAVVRSANRIVHDPGVAEELAQDVFLELWRRRESLPDGSSLAGYLLQSVRNRALNHLRHLQVQKKSQVFVEALHEPTEPADADSGHRELEQAIQEAIAALPPRTREVFLLSRERNLRYSEIAEQLGVTVKAVEANMSRALRQLRERLSPFMGRPED
jgi:RNA polymerase sigma-70 factor (ECF subfamily)